MTQPAEYIVDALRAAGEPTRLRLLALLREADLAVGEMVQILDQSQPRLSHHLKALTGAGLVERLPEGAWVFHRAATRGSAKRLLDTIFAEVDLKQGDFANDMQALAEVRQRRTESAEAYFSAIAEDWDRLRAMHFPNEAIEQALLDAAGPGPFDRVVDLGTGTGRMMVLFAPRAREVEGLDMSHQMLTVARGNLAQAGLTNARVRQGDVTKTPFEDASADLVIIHQVLHFIETPGVVIEEAARIVRPGGQLLIVDFAPHDLDFLRAEHGHRRLGIRSDDMLEWASQVGLSLDAPRQFDPPKTLKQGLSVHVWTAKRPAKSQEAAA